MANRIYNKQITPKGYKAGGKIMKAAKKDGKVRGDIKLGRALVEAFGSKKTINKMKSNIQDQNRVKKMGGGRAKGLIPEAQEKAKSMTVKSSKRRVKKMGGGRMMPDRVMLKSGGMCKLASKGKGRAYGKNS